MAFEYKQINNGERVIFDGRIQGVYQKRRLPFKCSDCNKEFTPDKQGIIYSYNDDGTISLHCPKCVTEFEKHWTLVSADIHPAGNNTGIGMTTCRFADGSIRDIAYGTLNVDNRIPKEFWSQLSVCKQKKHEELRNQPCVNMKTIDTFAEQYTVFTFKYGVKVKVAFKVSASGSVIYKPEHIAQLSPEQLKQINLYLKSVNKENLCIAEQQ